MLHQSLLIFELSLQGDGNPYYYKNIINKFAEAEVNKNSTAIKLQYYTNPMGRVKRTLSPQDLESVRAHAKELGFCVGCTGHDIPSMQLINEMDFDFIKIAHINYRYEGLFKACSDKFTIMSVPTTEPDLNHRWTDVVMSCCPVYPNIHGWDGRFDGFSCHSASYFVTRHVIDAVKRGAKCNEVHVTDLHTASVKPPLPGDIPVSIPVHEAINLSFALDAINDQRLQSSI